jgi:hypothetical protein
LADDLDCFVRLPRLLLVFFAICFFATCASSRRAGSIARRGSTVAEP